MDIFDQARRAVLEEDYADDTLIGDVIQDILAQLLIIPIISVGTGDHSIIDRNLADD